MEQVSHQNIRLSEYTLEELPLLKRLKDGVLKAKPEVCIERSKYITAYLKNMSSPEEPVMIRNARAINHYLCNKAPMFFDDNLIAGTTSSKFFGAPVYPEFNGLLIWPEVYTISTREKNPLLLKKGEADELNYSIFPYWMDRTIHEYTRKRFNNPDCMKLFERLVFFLAGKAVCISHTVPDYTPALEKGVEYSIKEAAAKEKEIRSRDTLTAEEKKSLEFYISVQIVLQGVIAYAGNLSRRAASLADDEKDPVKRKVLKEMSKICARVPAKPARTLREAVNAIWIIQIAIHAESINIAMSPGRLDQVLYPYYKQDIENSKITVKEALELVGCLWLKINDNTNLVPETAEELFGGASTVPAVTLGGIDEDGNDAVNDLTYIMLRVTELLMTRDPNVNARYNYKKNSYEYRNRLAEVVYTTKAIPAFYNDIAAIETLVNQGVKREHANDYAIIGCVELASAGRSYDSSSSVMLNLVSALELALYNGKRPATGDEQISPETGDPESFTSFEEFRQAFIKQLKWLMGQAIELHEYFGMAYQEVLPSPLLSVFFKGPMESGKDLIFGGALYNASGATHIGFADTVDSLSAIEQAIFVDRVCGFDELKKALKTDFTRHARLHSYLINRTPKYGCGDPVSQGNASALILFLYEEYQKHVNYRGGKYRPAYWTMTNHAGQGKIAGALPSGRKAGKVFASGITPASQVADDLASCLKSVARLNTLFIPGGLALNLKYPSIYGDEDIKRFSDAIEAYFRYGGLQVQFNIMSYEMLIDAKNNPEKYPELLVRVSGYSAYFKDLNEEMKNEIITRTEYSLRNGAATRFRDQYKGMLPYA